MSHYEGEFGYEPTTLESKSLMADVLAVERWARELAGYPPDDDEMRTILTPNLDQPFVTFSRFRVPTEWAHWRIRSEIDKAFDRCECGSKSGDTRTELEFHHRDACAGKIDGRWRLI